MSRFGARHNLSPAATRRATRVRRPARARAPRRAARARVLSFDEVKPYGAFRRGPSWTIGLSNGFIFFTRMDTHEAEALLSYLDTHAQLTF